MEPIVSAASGQAADACRHRWAKVSVCRIGAKLRLRSGAHPRGIAANQSIAAMAFQRHARSELVPRTLCRIAHSAEHTVVPSEPEGKVLAHVAQFREQAAEGAGEKMALAHRPEHAPFHLGRENRHHRRAGRANLAINPVCQRPQVRKMKHRGARAVGTSAGAGPRGPKPCPNWRWACGGCDESVGARNGMR